jgi:hypothetical protein
MRRDEAMSGLGKRLPRSAGNHTRGKAQDNKMRRGQNHKGQRAENEKPVFLNHHR